MSEDVDTIKKILTKKKPSQTIPKENFLSTGSTLLNLAFSGKTYGGLFKGAYFYFVGDSNSGKAQPLTSKVLTANGWKTMGELQIGDKVVDPDGGHGEVTKIYPQGEKEVFKVVFSDGSSTYCCDDHLWSVSSITLGHRSDHRPVKTLREIRNTLRTTNGTIRHHIPVTKPVEYDMDPVLLIDPYVLGVVLGDGCMVSGRGISISSHEEEIRNKVSGRLPEGVVLSYRRSGNYDIACPTRGKKNKMNELARSLKIMGCRSETKFIPKCYLYASVEDRIQLLHGLMDTDGYASQYRGSTASYCSTSKRLMVGIRKLVRSLGGITTPLRCKKEPKFTYKGETRTGQPSYYFAINLPKNICPFSLKRKAERVKVKELTRGPKKGIVDVISVGKKECQCIRVSTKRNLYVTDNFIVTHNSWLAHSCLAEAANNDNFCDHRLIYDKTTEDGAHMDLEYYFGSKAARRIVAPGKNKDGSPRHSTTIEEFFDHVYDAYKEAEPFIYILDSEDGLSSEDEIKKANENRNARRKNKAKEEGEGEEKQKGSYGDGKAKKNSSGIRQILPWLKQRESILIVISQTRDNIGFTAKFKPKTRSGGHALSFYAQVEAWSSTKEKLTKTYKGKKLEVGTLCKIQVKRTRETGKGRSVDIAIYTDAGIDDTGSCIRWLVDWGHWKGSLKNATVTAPEFEFTGKIEDLVIKIESANEERKLRKLVQGVWNKIEEAVKVTRKPRYQ